MYKAARVFSNTEHNSKSLVKYSNIQSYALRENAHY